MDGDGFLGCLPRLLPFPEAPSDDADDSSVQLLDAAPEHMRKITNAKRPISVVDSDEEAKGFGGEAERVIRPDNAAGPSRKRLRHSSSDGDVDAEPLVAIPLHSSVDDHPVAGPSRPPSPPLNPDNLLLEVLEVLPDLCPEWAMTTLKAVIQNGHAGQSVGRVVGAALEIPSGYPKARPPEALTREKPLEIGESYRDPLFRRDKRCGEAYRLASLIALEEKFSRVPVPQWVRAR